MRSASLAALALFGSVGAQPVPEPFSPWPDAGPSLFAGATFSPDARTVYFTKYSSFDVDALKTIFSPDGRTLYFASNRRGRLEMWQVAFSLADALRLTEGS